MTTRARKRSFGHAIFSLCCPLVSVFTCFEFVDISFYFQISQEKIKLSLLTQRTVSRRQRVQVSVATVVVHFKDISDSVAVSDH